MSSRLNTASAILDASDSDRPFMVVSCVTVSALLRPDCFAIAAICTALESDLGASNPAHLAKW